MKKKVVLYVHIVIEFFIRRMKMKVTKEMVENWLGSTDILELLTELANGEYEQEQFKQDVIDTWEEENEDE
jgi:hypothetical protein